MKYLGPLLGLALMVGLTILVWQNVRKPGQA